MYDRKFNVQNLCKILQYSDKQFWKLSKLLKMSEIQTTGQNPEKLSTIKRPEQNPEKLSKFRQLSKIQKAEQSPEKTEQNLETE